MADRTLMPVVAGALLREGRVLVQQRPAGKALAGLWEFPGGKVEVGEGPAAALARELAEELGIGVDPADCCPFTFASEALGARHLLLLLYRLTRWTGEPCALPAAALRWVHREELAQLPMPPADRPLRIALAPLLDR